LELAGFYQAPYKFRAEVPIEIAAEGDREEVLPGRIDALVLQNRLWIVLIDAIAFLSGCTSIHLANQPQLNDQQIQRINTCTDLGNSVSGRSSG
jgi:hypothetical protein